MKIMIMREKNIKFVIITLLLIFSSSAHSQSDTIETNVPALKDVFANDFYIGCLLSYPHIKFPNDPPVPGAANTALAPNGGYLIKYHMNSMSPGNNMKPQYTIDMNASTTAYNNAASDAERDSANVNPVVRFNGNLIAQLDWAERQGFTFRGHTLVWHSQTPGTGFFRTGYNAQAEYLTPELMNQRMENYIKEVIRILHEDWPGLLSAMDVVNEAINDGSGTDRTNGNEWYTVYGDMSYIMKAFEYTRKYTEEYGETQIKLYYNDYNTHDPAKADGIVRLCTPIYQAGFLDGIGMQEHNAWNDYPTAGEWIASYNKFDPICDEIAVTEFDVQLNTTSPSAQQLELQANQYAQLFKCFLERSYFSGRGKVITVAKDGLNDEWTFRSQTASSLWDRFNKTKPAFFAVVDVGVNYNQLDSLIAYADTLNETEYTAESWNTFAAAVELAQSSMNQNYSSSVSAAASLTEANSSLSTAVAGLVKITTDVEDYNSAPKIFALQQNYPNPFNPVTRIKYSVPSNSYVSLKVFNSLGQEIATLFE
ncbi:MAG: endo-1,4-beta-xylanase, partial [Ignavibacteriaceae bacterium]